MATEDLKLRTNDSLARQMCEQLMAEQMRIDALRNPGGHGVLFDQLTQPSGRVGVTDSRERAQDCNQLKFGMTLCAFLQLPRTGFRASETAFIQSGRQSTALGPQYL